MVAKPITLQIGAGHKANRQHGWINCDLYPGPNVDVVFDATKKWPFADNSVQSIIACHVLEHLWDFESFFKEVWRVLDPTLGRLYMALPHAASDAGWGDPTHVQQWNSIRFCFLQPGYRDTSNNPQHDWKHPFKVEQIAERINGRLGWLCRWPLWNLFGRHLINFLWNGIVEMKVQLKPLKTPQDLAVFASQCVGNAVPTSYFVYEHEIEGRNLKPGEAPKTKWLTHYLRGFTQQGKAFGENL